jgi:UDP-glucose 4-epimerase
MGGVGMKRELKGPVLVTGGSGFIGRHLCEELMRQGYPVKIFDKRNHQDVANGMEVYGAVQGCGAIFNLAGVLGTSELNTEEGIMQAIEANLVGALNCLQAAHHMDIPLVQICKPNPWLNTYSITKRASEDFARLYARDLGVKVWLPRWFNVFGPGQHYGTPQKLVPTAIVRALKKEPLEIYGDGYQTTDHIYVKDAVRATIKLFETDELMGQPVDIGSGDEVTVNALVDFIVSKIGEPWTIYTNRPMRSGEEPGARLKANISAIYSTGYRPEYSLIEALDETIVWYVNNITLL